ncbi:phage antirepressor N-terminal domain-containing protein [Klebsiella pneumoniae]|uniref:phage antirepressor N-terminal domain-containing protein n=1 Tax=Klebsiella pneumoniae TaxID=573 RepID=UPI0014629493|nr:phage antirepressor N-terminal domain-containing protein [Klebsiella pneumoniae]HDT4129784.1 phage antirepressor N-terminal domain-containing protein [Klebsiella pneumoniae subsp. pneumoniae]EIX9575932.1 phage antirepressor N-terminal domain-containing protein [Klebsiella pneumoniae]MBC5410104.1 phage antirepressor N-terminal domain-containing protein [Klebsiella pneumoniae]MBP3989463.1 phage antirepressor N-terminal domain-containing protein [Klebsiella pneumoniae]MCB3577251.1 phage antire
MANLAINQSACTINVPFYGSELYVVNHNGEPYAPMKPIVEGMGLAWQSQLAKIKQRFSSTVTEIVMVAADGKSRTMICLALRKLAAWLNTISPNKVRPEIRERVIRYQEECDDVLYDYWTKGQAVNPRKMKRSTAKQLTPLRQTAERLIATGLGRIYPDIWKLVHQRFDVEHIHQLEPTQIGEAIDYLNALDGELLPREPVFTPVPVSLPPRSASRVMLYLDEKGIVQGTLPLQEDQVVMSFEGFVSYFRKKGWLVAPKEEIAKELIGAIQSLP